MTLRLPDPCLVVLVGATGAGKSAWAGAWFHADQIVSSDRLRAVVGAGERDQRASRDAFELLDLIVAKRLRRGLTTVVDTTGLEPKRRAAWRALAEREGVPAYAVVVDTPEKVVRERNRARGTPVPAKVVAAQLREAAGAPRRSPARGSPACYDAGPVELVPPPFLAAPEAAARQGERSAAARVRPPALALRLGRAPAATARTLADVARAAEEAGFTSLWLMDHFLQIPQVGREWEDMLESYTTLGYLAGVTERIRLGTLVTGVTYRNLGHLAKVVATLDVALRRPRAVRARDRVVRARAPALRLGLPAARRALRAARGRARAAAADVGPRRAALRGPHDRGRRGDLLPAAAAGAHPDPRRRLGGAADAAARGAPRRRLQPVRRRGDRAPQARGAARRTARPRGAIRPRSRSRTSRPRASWRRASRARGRAPRPSRSTSAATASWPRPACRRRSSGCRTLAGRESVTRFADVIAAFRCVTRPFAAALARGPLRRGLRRRDGRRRSSSRETVGSGPQTATIIRPDVERPAARRAVPARLGRQRGRATTGRGSSTSRARATPSSTRATRTRCVEPPPQVLGNVLAGGAPGARRTSTRTRARSWSRATPRAGRWRPTTPGSPAAPGSPCRSRCSAPTPGRRLRGCRSGSRRSTRRGSRRRRALIALAGTRDRVVGMRPARRLARLAGARRRSARRRQRPGGLGPPRPAAGRRRRAARVLGAPGPPHRRAALSLVPT